MIIVKVMGGLGNQMQQYALYRKLQSLGKEVKLDLSWFDPEVQSQALAPRRCELSWFEDLPMEVCTEKEKKRFVGGDSIAEKLRRKLGGGRVFRESRMYHPEVFDLEDAYLEGYWACNKYYWDIMDELRELFVFPVSASPEIAAANDQCRRAMEDPSEISVAIHIRRGDYLAPENAPLLAGICTDAYYAGAVNYLEARFIGDNPLHFYIFSDDLNYAAQCRFGTRGEENTVVGWNQGEDAMLDMDLMRRCRCVICANSTFSFWGARLNPGLDKVLIRPLRHRNNQRVSPEKMLDYWEDFVLIDKDGRWYQ